VGSIQKKISRSCSLSVQNLVADRILLPRSEVAHSRTQNVHEWRNRHQDHRQQSFHQQTKFVRYGKRAHRLLTIPSAARTSLVACWIQMP
jgi:hypothetical protein